MIDAVIPSETGGGFLYVYTEDSIPELDKTHQDVVSSSQEIDSKELTCEEDGK